MTYLIFNEYYNRGVKTVELRDKKHNVVTLKTTNENFQLGDFVIVDVVNSRQIISSKVIRPEDFLDYYNPPRVDVEVLKVEISKYFAVIKNDNIKTILNETIFKHSDFFYYPAAKTIHHAYIGGLAHHTLNILKQCEFYANMYNLNHDLLYAAAMLHDYGKLRELSDYGITYTIEGNLLGHINIAYEEVSHIAIMEDCNTDNTIIALKHMILSHHGKLEYGSPKEPMTIEAYVLSQIDEMDAKVDLFKRVLLDTSDNKLSPPIMAMDRRRIFNLKPQV